MTESDPLPAPHDVLIRMYRMAVWDAAGRQYLPVFNYDWKEITVYAPATTAIARNTEGLF